MMQLDETGYLPRSVQPALDLALSDTSVVCLAYSGPKRQVRREVMRLRGPNFKIVGGLSDCLVIEEIDGGFVIWNKHDDRFPGFPFLMFIGE